MDFRKTHLEAFVKKYGMKLGFMSAFCKASAYALQDQPVVNAVIEGNVSFKKMNMKFFFFILQFVVVVCSFRKLFTEILLIFL